MHHKMRIMQEAQRNCLDCGKVLHGRQDKKFCNDYCRNNYYNRQNREQNALIRKVNAVLRKNRQILKALNPTGKGKVSREELLVKGFDFHYFTNIYITRRGATYYFCYDQGYLPLEDGKYALVEKQDYVR